MVGNVLIVYQTYQVQQEIERFLRDLVAAGAKAPAKSRPDASSEDQTSSNDQPAEDKEVVTASELAPNMALSLAMQFARTRGENPDLYQVRLHYEDGTWWIEFTKTKEEFRGDHFSIRIQSTNDIRMFRGR
jgi:hypothetical protein